ncbi:MAG TPA: tetratricopeptide repeat protein [Candidatus Acidoferrales bacterium]|nr:tetratricopeptide repeat protein [Candidatus Acidoferrales bacterium]
MSGFSDMSTAHANENAASRRPEWLVPLLVVCAVIAVFGRTMGFQFVFDDTILIVGNPFIQSAANIPRFFTEHFWSGIAIAQKSYYRPLSLLWLLANWKVFGPHPAGWHAASVLLHALNTLLVYLLALRFLGRGRSAAFAAGGSAALFGLHPIQAEAVSWISCFNDLLACLFVLVSFHAYCNAREPAAVANPSIRKRAILWYCVSFTSYAAAVMCKEPAALFPLVPLLYEVCDPKNPAHPASAGSSTSETIPEAAFPSASRPAARARFLQLLPYFAIAGIYLLLRKNALGTVTTPQVRILTWRTEWLTLPSVVRAYVAHLVWPRGLSPFYDMPYHQSLSAAGVALPFLVLMLLAALFLWAAWRSPVARIFTGWMLFFFAPTLHLGVLPRGELMHDRYLYIPMAGLGILAGLGIAALERRWANAAVKRWPLYAASVAVSAVLAVLAFHQSLFWEDNVTLYTRGVTIAPHNGTAANNLGATLLASGQWDAAMAQLGKAVELAPGLFLAHYDMAIGYYEVGRFSEAEASFKRALAIAPRDPESNLYLGMTYYHTDRLPEAMEYVRKAIALQPAGPGYHFALAIMLKQSGDVAGARAEFEAELKRDPNHQPTLDQLRLLDHPAPPAAAKQ